MIKFREKLFSVRKYGKGTETVLIARLTMYITLILFCMAGMAIAAYAYFSASVISENNVIQAAHFDVKISIEEIVHDPQTSEQGVPVNVIQDGVNLYHANLEGGKEYLVTVRPIGTADTGFVLITAGGARYFTQQIDRATGYDLVFRLVPYESMAVAFMPHFGTSALYEEYKNGVDDPFYVKEDARIELIEITETTEDLEQEKEPYYHLVEQGDTLYAISRLYGVEISEIQDLNQLGDSSLILAGQKLLLPDHAVVLTEPAVAVGGSN